MEATPKLGSGIWAIDLTVVLGSVIVAAIVLLLTILASRRLSMRPTGLQNFMEMVIEFIQGVTRMSLDHKQADKFLGMAFTIFLFIFFSNQLGVIFMLSAEVHEPIPSLGLTSEVLEDAHNEVSIIKSPTADLSVAFALSFAITLFAHFLGIRKNPKKYAKHYFEPYIPMFPLHIIDELAKPTTHGMRLWANIFAGEVLIIIMLKAGLLAGLPLLIWVGFSIFVGTIQAFIFTVLAMVYIGQKVADDH
ncbi:F0F1 ATP synthase subunit A [Mechercharimyces sp. CAU 1602]|uniref:F0F1 ATP synthase subunit A n=1 Tax=Mechercharimyces sp. CAU 1602 TaxID=2973933 RepID=UPI0021619B0C|nr:F0F1 ATP synthase subunit A [Mechercharimyces sp. CAU 1602]MCS1352286.1 F0F1 ATP synthase subunit A [Mechercharimyces sp. CAU 1602]